jgi:hypothetical protein
MHKKRHQPVAFTADLIGPGSPTALNLTAVGAETCVRRPSGVAAVSFVPIFQTARIIPPNISFLPKKNHIQLTAFFSCF